MSFVKNTLLSDEKLILFIKPHWIVYGYPSLLGLCFVFFWIFGGFFPTLAYHLPFINLTFLSAIMIVFFILAAYQYCLALIKRSYAEYAVTDKRVIMKEGWLTLRSLEIFWDKIEAIHVNQNILGRILKYGGIAVVGTGGSHDRFSYVPDPLTFRHEVQAQIERQMDASRKS